MELFFHHWKSEVLETSKVILLHGLGGTGAIWRPIALSLENEFEVLAPDQRGHGKSQPNPENADFSPESYAADVADLMAKQSFHPAWVIGHSMGVRTACALARQRFDWIRGMVLIDLGFGGLHDNAFIETLSGFLKILPENFSSRRDARAFMNENSPDPAIAQYLMAVSQVTDNGNLTFPFDRAGLLKTLEAGKNAPIRSWIEESARRDMPILVLRGTRSQVWSKSEYEEEKRHFGSFPSMRFEEIADAGHGLPFEKRNTFVSLFKEWSAHTKTP